MPGWTLAGFTPLLLRFPPPSLNSYPPPLSEPSPLPSSASLSYSPLAVFVPLLSPCLSIHSLSFMISLSSCLLSTCFIFFPLTLLTPSPSSASLSSFLLPSIFIFYCTAWLKQSERPRMTPINYCGISHSKIIGITVLKKIFFFWKLLGKMNVMTWNQIRSQIRSQPSLTSRSFSCNVLLLWRRK